MRKLKSVQKFQCKNINDLDLVRGNYCKDLDQDHNLKNDVRSQPDHKNIIV